MTPQAYAADLRRKLASGFSRERTIFASAFFRRLFELLAHNYDLKAAGLSDTLGNRWKPLHPKTIAARPPKTPPGQRGLLSPEENALWKSIFARNLKRLASQMGLAEAKREAARIAWNMLRARGARTRLEAYGSRHVPILIDTGRLRASFEPGQYSPGAYAPPREQIAKQLPSGYDVGTKVPYSASVCADRPIIPPDPSAWINEAIEAGLTALTSQESRR